MKLWVGTPVYGHQVSWIYHETYVRMFRRRRLFDLAGVDCDKLNQNHDLTKARAGIVRRFLRETDGDALLMQDGDVGCEPVAIEGMCSHLGPGFEFIGCPYRRKDAEEISYTYWMEEESPLPAHKPLRQVDGTGLGLTLLSRNLLQVMTEGAFASGNVYVDDDGHEVADLFDLVRDKTTRKKLSEDYSFSVRAREAGFKVWLYLGAGSPAVHAGHGVFEGNLSDFTRRREKEQEEDKEQEKEKENPRPFGASDANPLAEYEAFQRRAVLDVSFDPLAPPEEPGVP